MPAIPRDAPGDHSLAMLADPYRFIAKRCRALQSDVFETRVLLRRTLCMTGPEAAALFYDPQRFQRGGAAPEPVRATLFGKGGVQTLDGDAHRMRKALFMHATAPERIATLSDAVAQQWLLSARSWSDGQPVALYDALHPLLTRAVCSWAGVPLREHEVEPRCRQLTALFDQAAAPGLGHFRSRRARDRVEAWLSRLIDQARAGQFEILEHTPMHTVAWHHDADGQLLPPRIAAVELANLLRPTVAVSVFIVFVAHALHLHPACRERLQQGDPAYLDAFVQEVRRWYPFFPAVVARVRDDFEWKGYRFVRGRRVMLDLYGTNHDPRSWDDPDAFAPERFLARAPTPFNFIPQGGAQAADHHRCPGEGITVALMKQAVLFLLRGLRYTVPEQDLTLDFGRLPALPRDRMVIRDVRLVHRRAGAATAGS
ncbi:cytochrome P450 [Cupriavidus gilardii]|uniref:cytochrome P450 n=1 Tax=Cupriavidus gilardii TaxID=82541 RepID=UPI001580E17C|nr:cytochrome P450 [Cupriavidus gilardii]MCT9070048.1 cytochrome P450 [Cupriavidus gilardii]QKS61970.1 cytochrome P450 [Cupriavidus gilardii]